MCAYHQFNFIPFCRISSNLYHVFNLIARTCKNTTWSLKLQGAAHNITFFPLAQKCMLLLKLTYKINKSNIIMLNDNTWRLSITKVHIIHRALWRDNFFCRRYDYMYITDKPDQPRKWCQLTTIQVKSISIYSMILNFYNSFLKRTDGRWPWLF